MTEKLNTVLLFVTLLLLVHLSRRQPCEVGRFQKLDSPAHQELALDTKTGQRCWVWLDPAGDVPPAPPPGFVLDKKPSSKIPPELSDIQACSELAKH